MEEREKKRKEERQRETEWEEEEAGKEGKGSEKAVSERGLEHAEFWSRREAGCVLQPSGDSRNKLGFEMR